MREFVHLHVHTEYSLLDGFSRIDRVVSKARELGMNALAMTDHGVMFGAVDFYKTCKKEGIKPIIGCEVYVQTADERKNRHLVLLVKNQIGYQNLIKLVSDAFVHNFYYKPRVKFEDLKAHSEGLICLSACMNGEIAQLALLNDIETAVKTALTYKEIFGEDHYYIELQDQNIPEEKELNQRLIQIARTANIPLVCTNDVHYTEKKDATAHDVLLAIQTASDLSDTERLRFPNDEFYLKSPEEMFGLFSHVEEALTNTVKISQMIDFDFDFSKKHLPRFSKNPDYRAKDTLERLSFEGLKQRIPDYTEIHTERLRHELSVIDSMGYNDYFLIVWDFMRFAREQRIATGPGRGSAGGSLVAYALRIIDINPLQYDLIFERFLNPERISMPDIDIDFEDERRQEVIDYVTAKYGQDHVAQIITFGTFGARTAVRDVGRVMGLSYAEVDRVAKAIPAALNMTLERALKESERLSQMLSEDRIRLLIEYAKAIEGVPRHVSTHAAGVVISDQPMDCYVPLYLQEQAVSTQYNMTLLEELGLLKMDFLGLRNLSIIKHTLHFLKEEGIEIDLSRLEDKDPKTFRMLCEGDTLGIFQLESPGMKSFFKELKPEKIEDIIAGISLYRPGPMESIPVYLRNRGQKISYIHPVLENILSVTNGVMVYQEQVMQIVRDLAGYSFAQSDLVRRAMSKKKVDVMNRERQVFLYGDGDKVRGSLKNGLSEEQANRLFDQMMDFANYAFNKSHAAGYAMIAYQTAYLKAHYPKEFMAALMSSVMGSSGTLTSYMEDARDHKIEVLKPDVNSSFAGFRIQGEGIRFGLLAVKNVGSTLIASILRNREQGYRSLDDLLMKLDPAVINKRAIESLIRSGALDSLGETRRSMMMRYEQLIESIQRGNRTNALGQLSLFDEVQPETSFVDTEEFSKQELLEGEKEVLGMYFSGHPLESYRSVRDKYHCRDLLELSGFTEESGDNTSVSVLAMIHGITYKVTRAGERMAFLELEDEYGAMEAIVFAKTYQELAPLLQKEKIYVFQGRVSVKEDQEPRLIVMRLIPLNEESLRVKKERLYLKLKDMDEERLKDILLLCDLNPGDTDVLLYLEERKELRKLQGHEVSLSDFFTEQLKAILGDSCVVVR